MSVEIFEKDGRWCYRVDSVVQEWHPDHSGFVPMTFEEASTFATILDQRLHGNQEESESTITKLEFMSRFTDTELITIYSAAKASVQIEVWLEKVKMATDISLVDPRTVTGIYGLEYAGLIGTGRAKEILSI